MQTVTLIIDKRREISVKYRKLLQDDSSIVLISPNIISAMKLIRDMEPDLIIISDSMGGDLDSYCSEIRALTYNMRPIIVATSKSSDINDKLKVLENGADDFISEPISSKEFVMRIKAHLRRELESNLDDNHMFPNRNYSMRALKRLITSNKPWAGMIITINNFRVYREVYTKLASDKLSQTYSAIIASTLGKEDFLGSLSENEFLVITDEIKAEMIAKFLTFAFDTVSERFYSQNDIARGFVMSQGDSLAGRRSEFVHSSIGIVTAKTREYKDYQEILSDMTNICKLATLPNKSNYLMERTKLTAEDSVSNPKYNNKVLVIEKDESMRLLLATILNFQGYVTKTYAEFKQIVIDEPPAVIILDEEGGENQTGLDVCKIIKDSHMLQKSKLIITSIFHDKETALMAGADLYLPKPYDVATLVRWVDSFVKEFNF